MKTLMTKEEVRKIVSDCMQAKMSPEHIEMYFNSNSELSPSDWLDSSGRELSTEDYIKMMRYDQWVQDHTVVKL